MLINLLNETNTKLDKIIKLTNEDIELIKAAKHDELAKRDILKNSAIADFENSKIKLNRTLIEISTKNGAPLEEILNDNEGILLKEFKAKLLELKEVNKQCSRLVVALNEFYTSLVSKLFTFDSSGYNKTNPLPAAIMRISA